MLPAPWRLPLLAFTLLAWPCASSRAETLRVPEDFPAIQLAIDAAEDGDEVLVAAGTYVERIDTLGKAITVQGTVGPWVTVIDGDFAGTVVTCTSGEGPDTVISGFTIRNGVSAAYGGGALIIDASPTFSKCWFSLNRAAYGGGGLFCDGGSPVIDGCGFFTNLASWGAGALFRDGVATISGTRFEENIARGEGGGLETSGDNEAHIHDCYFRDNLGGSGGFGGGAYIQGRSAEITDCFFHRNSSDVGAALSTDGAEVTVDECRFHENTAYSGGAIYAYRGAITIRKCRFEYNRSHCVMATAAAMTLTDCLFNRNAGGALTLSGWWPYEDTTLLATNCEFIYNAAGWGAGAFFRELDRTSATFIDCSFTGNSAIEAGAIFDLAKYPPLELVRCDFTDNHSIREGGAVASFETGLVAEDCVFRENSAGRLGGAIFTWGENSVVSGCTFEDNSADAGGAIYHYDPGRTSVSDSSFCRNVPNDAEGDWIDKGGNMFCCTGDADGDGILGFGDILRMLAAWGPCEECPEDVDGDGEVDFGDVLVVLAGWGTCP